MKRKKIIGIGYLGATAMVLFSGFFSLSYGAATYGVRYTKHNLGSTGIGGFKATMESEVCVFCHTPHNSVAGQNFLWNRVPQAGVSPTSFNLYSSPTLSSAALGAAISDVSKMCMSCHDGVTALNSMANPTSRYQLNELGGPVGAGDAFSTWIYDDPFGIGDWGPNIGEGVAPLSGGNLRNDHPISFSYTDAQGQDSGLKLISNPISEGLVFWGPNSDQIECVTCHDPHINYNSAQGGDPALAKFLRRSNASSNLCFACHNK